MAMPVRTGDSGSEAAQARLAGLLAARLCHDLGGPLGGVLAALELAEEESEAAGEDAPLPVALAGARAMADRLRLLRAAWGAEPGPLSAGEVVVLADGLANRGRLELDFAGLVPEPDFSPETGQVVLTMLLLGASALPGGGTIALAGRADEEVLLRVSGPGAAWPQGLARVLARALAGQDVAWDEADTRGLLSPMLALLARRAGRSLRLLLPAGSAPAGAVPVGPPPLLLGAPQAGTTEPAA